jgi:tetratricopeptide (TPR) repeat protein
MSKLYLLFLLTMSLSTPLALAQDEEPQGQQGESEIDRLVRLGSVPALESKLGKTPADLARIAEAARNAAGREQRDAARKEKLYGDAEKRYQAVLKALDESDEKPARRDTLKTRAYLDLAGMVMSGWAGGDMNTYEITGGRFGDNKRLIEKLRLSRDYYRKALEIIAPLYEDRFAREDELLALGIFDDVKRYKLDTDFNVGFASLYLGMVLPADSPERAGLLQESEKLFQGLVDFMIGNAEVYQCNLGLAVALSEQKRYDDAMRQFDLAMSQGATPVLIMQTRYEKARALVNNEKFEEARNVLKPLLELNADALPAENRGGKLYVHLAEVWDAYSYLREGLFNARLAAQGGAGHQALEVRARRTRETGLARMQRLQSRGGPWPAVVKLWMASSINENADPATLTTVELKFAADQLSSDKKYAEAVKFLEEARKRTNPDPDVAAQILFDLALNCYRMDDLRSAAANFDRVAREHPANASAEQAAEFAYKCWGQLAQETKAHDDFAKLAASLKTLIDGFKNQPDRDELLWFLPTAQQAAGQYAEAVKGYQAIPKDSKRYDEARFRIAQCGRLAVEAQRDKLSPEAFLSQAQAATKRLTDYAEQALADAKDAAAPTRRKQLTEWAAEASVSAAELLTGPGVEKFTESLGALEGFEDRYGDSDLMSRVLAARIRAYRGLGDFDKARTLLDQYLAAVPAEKAAAVLAGLARGMREEIETQREAGRTQDAAKMARDAVEIFEQLVKSLSANPQQAGQVETVKFGLGRMLYYAGEFDRAEKLAGELLESSPNNGRYIQLRAQVLTARMDAAGSPEAVKAAEDAWAKLLANPALRTSAPELFWEARYNWLSIQLRKGESAEVAKAVRQDRVWYPDLGGPAWSDKFVDLHRRAAEAAGLDPELPGMPGAETAAPQTQPAADGAGSDPLP